MQVISECNARCLNGVFLCRGSDLVMNVKEINNKKKTLKVVESNQINVVHKWPGWQGSSAAGPKVAKCWPVKVFSNITGPAVNIQQSSAIFLVWGRDFLGQPLFEKILIKHFFWKTFWRKSYQIPFFLWRLLDESTLQRLLESFFSSEKLNEHTHVSLFERHPTPRIALFVRPSVRPSVRNKICRIIDTCTIHTCMLQDQSPGS